MNLEEEIQNRGYPNLKAYLLKNWELLSPDYREALVIMGYPPDGPKEEDDNNEKNAFGTIS